MFSYNRASCDESNCASVSYGKFQSILGEAGQSLYSREIVLPGPDSPVFFEI